jgi:hypothetical protein
VQQYCGIITDPTRSTAIGFGRIPIIAASGEMHMASGVSSRWAALAIVLTLITLNPPCDAAQPESFATGQSLAADAVPKNSVKGNDRTPVDSGGGHHRLVAAAKVAPAHSAAALGKTAGLGSAPAAETRWQWSLNTGYRQDDLEWSFALPGIDPRSELTWRDIESFQLEFGLQRRFLQLLRLKGVFAYAVILNGRNQDSDYDGDNRTLEFSRSNNATDDGDLWDISLGLAYDIRLFGDRLLLSPLLGYAFSDQNLKISDGVQTLPPTGPFEGLDSSYDATWYGPWIGMELQYNSYGGSAPSPGYEVFLRPRIPPGEFRGRSRLEPEAGSSPPAEFRAGRRGQRLGLNRRFQLSVRFPLGGESDRKVPALGDRCRQAPLFFQRRVVLCGTPE